MCFLLSPCFPGFILPVLSFPPYLDIGGSKLYDVSISILIYFNSISSSLLGLRPGVPGLFYLVTLVNNFS